jgi:hypothetical protein
LQWHQISGGGAPALATEARTWAQVLDIAKGTTLPVSDRCLAMG